MNQELKIDDAYRALIYRSKNILAVRFVGTTPVEVISKNPLAVSEKQIVLTREEILGDFEQRKNNI